MAKAFYAVGFWIRETGQALDRLGCRLQGNYFFHEQNSRSWLLRFYMMSTKILEVLELSMMVSSDELMLTKMLEDNLIAPVLLSSPWTILLHLLFEPPLAAMSQNAGWPWTVVVSDVSRWSSLSVAQQTPRHAVQS
uniref:Uncharacterized protein n=1 Tax=Triticum urartu TaxID=4572 RepID=A0A8R7PRZ7_TRIUA